MRNIGSVEDRLLIHELYGYYSDVSSRGDKAGWLSCWTNDCCWKSAHFDVRGKEAIGKQWDTLWDTFERVSFLSNLGFVEVDGDVARARAVVQEWINYTNGTTFRSMGYYEDELRRENDVWLFSSRNYINTAFETYSHAR